MTIGEIVELVALGMAIVSAIIFIIRGKVKDYIVEKMEEAEKLYENETDPVKKSTLKLKYVIEAVKEKYKIAALIVNIKKFVEKIIEITKQINHK